MGITAAVVGIAGTVATTAMAASNSGKGGGGGATGTRGGDPATYIPQAQPAMDKNYQALIQNMMPYATSIPNTVIPQETALAQGIANNQYAPLAQQGANLASQYGLGVTAPGQANAAASLYGMAQSGVPYASQILQTGFDPQQALYNRTQQQVMDQQNAINAQYGVSGSPYGAGVAGQTNTNFNIDWQNAQLQRQLAATQGFGNLTNATGRGFAGASDLSALAGGTMASAAGLPYATSIGQAGTGMNALNNLSSGASNAFGLSNTDLSALANYLRLGQGASQLALSGQNQAFNQGQVVGGNIGAGMYGLQKNLSTLFKPSGYQSSYPNVYGGGGGNVLGYGSATGYSWSPGATGAFQSY